MNALRAVFPLLSACAMTTTLAAQVRMNLRATMQIDGLQQWISMTIDERFWPIETNAFAPGDVDGDGDADLLASLNQGGGRVWLNDGNGEFLRHVALPGVASRCCALFDADGDGDLDAFLAGGGTAYGNAALSSLFRNDGTGAFSASPTIPSNPANDGFVTLSLGVGDLDADGDRDIVLFPMWPSVRIWRNDGTGTFTDQTAAMLPGGSVANQHGTLGDVEPDGDLDIVTTDPNGGTLLYRNDGTGVFTSQPAVPWPIPLPHAITADVDGDGLADQIGIGLGTRVPYVRRNLGGGVFQDVSTTWFEPHALVDRSFGWSWFACAAFDADGDADLDFVTGGSAQVTTSSTTVGVPPTLFVNSNRQRFVDGGRPPLPMQPAIVQSLAAGDVNGDGRIDLVISGGGMWNNSSVAWLQDAAGRFDRAGPIMPPNAAHPYSTVLGDVDGDGDLDVVALHGAGPALPGVPGQHRLLLNDGAASFTDVTSTHVPAAASSGGASCAIGDVDGDGDADLVIGSYEPSWSGPGLPLMLLRNDGTGAFTHSAAWMPVTGYDATFTALRDFDGDGDRDLVAALDESRAVAAWPSPMPTVVFFANDGTGTFTDETSTRLPPTAPAYGLNVLDVDHDGDLDVVQSQVVLVNDGSGVFTAQPAAPAADLVVDLDEDGSLDRVRGLHAGNGAYTRIEAIGGRTLFDDRGATGHLILPADLDRDGDVDLVVGPTNQSFGVWDLLRVDVVYNLRRDLRVAALPRLGCDYRLQLRATNGTGALPATFAFVAFATATLPQPVEIPGWGALQLDPTQMALLGTALIPDADTMVELAMPIPAAPSLFGLPLSCQALFVPIGNEAATHLSNAMTFPLER